MQDGDNLDLLVKAKTPPKSKMLQFYNYFFENKIMRLAFPLHSANLTLSRPTNHFYFLLPENRFPLLYYKNAIINFRQSNQSFGGK